MNVNKAVARILEGEDIYKVLAEEDLSTSDVTSTEELPDINLGQPTSDGTPALVIKTPKSILDLSSSVTKEIIAKLVIMRNGGLDIDFALTVPQRGGDIRIEGTTIYGDKTYMELKPHEGGSGSKVQVLDTDSKANGFKVFDKVIPDANNPEIQLLDLDDVADALNTFMGDWVEEAKSLGVPTEPPPPDTSKPAPPTDAGELPNPADLGGSNDFQGSGELPELEPPIDELPTPEVP